MVNFEYYTPTKVVFGKDRENEVGKLVKAYGGTKVLVHFGGGSVKRSGLLDRVLASLDEVGIAHVELGGVVPNPRLSKVREGIELGKAEGVDFLLAVGGGSVIDSTKAIGYGMCYDGDVWDFYEGKAVPAACLPIGCVLTIAAAGSEMSNSSVISNEEGWKKRGVNNDLSRARFAVMNPELTYTLPAYQTACGAVDMIAHICERYFTNTPNVGLTDRLCEALLKTIVEAAPKALENPMDYHARADLMWAGMLAHNDSCGVGRKQDWASHQIEHELSAFYDCAHGAGLAVVMPAWMSYVMPESPARFARFAVEVFGCELDPMDVERTAREGIRRLKSFFRLLGMPTTLKELGAKTEDIPAMVLHRAEKGFPFGGMVEIGPAEMADILLLCDEE